MKHSLQRVMAISFVSCLAFMPSLSSASSYHSSSRSELTEGQTIYTADAPDVTTRQDIKAGSLYVNRFLDAIETVQNRSDLVSASKLVVNPLESRRSEEKLDFDPEEHKAGVTESKSSMAIFRENCYKFNQERARFVKAFFEKTVSSMWMDFYTLTKEKYDKRQWSWLRSENIEPVLNKALLENIQAYEAKITFEGQAKAGQLPDKFKAGDSAILGHLEMTILGNSASDDVKCATKSRFVELLAFQAIFGDLLTDASTIVDPNQFAQRTQQVACLMAQMKNEFMMFIMDRDGYVSQVEETVKALKNLQNDFVASGIFSTKERLQTVHLFAYLPDDMKGEIEQKFTESTDDSAASSSQADDENAGSSDGKKSTSAK